MLDTNIGAARHRQSRSPPRGDVLRGWADALHLRRLGGRARAAAPAGPGGGAAGGAAGNDGIDDMIYGHDKSIDQMLMYYILQSQ